MWPGRIRRVNGPARGLGPGLKYETVLWAGPGLDILVAGRAGPGPHNSICGPGPGRVCTTAAGPGRAWASNHICGPGLGLDFRPVQGPSRYTYNYGKRSHDEGGISTPFLRLSVDVFLFKYLTHCYFARLT